MAQVHQGWCGDKDDLHDPEANVADGKLPVITHILATRLQRIADQIRLLIAPYALCSCSQYEYPEDEEDAHPYLANDSRVGLHLVQ
uniref:Uncharacterized protein n=1 Tax=Pygocentrus nattereri TaxID=42514 RepID=A0A3B4CDE7_PYGNA